MSALLTLALFAALQDRAEDFEEVPRPNVIYPGWERVRSAEHPAFNEIELVRDPARARSGASFLRLRTLGRNTALRLSPHAAWPVDPGRSYVFTAFARIEGAKKNGASAALIWLNQDFERVQEDRSVPAAASGEWSELQIDVPTLPPQTRWVSVRLDFEGPDLRGECAFDHLKLECGPRLTLERDLPSPEGGPAAPRLRFVVSGLPAAEYRLEVVTKDAQGEDGGLPVRVPIIPGRTVDLAMATHAPGYYEIRASVLDAGGPVVRRAWPLVVPERPSSPSEARRPFGGAFDPFAGRIADPAALARLLGLQHSRVTVWERPSATRLKAPAPDEILQLVRALARVNGMTVHGALAAPPADLGPEEDLFALLELPRDRWEKPLRETAAAYFEFIAQWQLGADGVTPRRGAAEAVAAAREVVQTASPGARLLTPLDPGLPLILPTDGATAGFLRALIEAAHSDDLKRPRLVPLGADLLDPRGYPRAPFLALRAVNDLLAGAVPRRDLTLADPALKDFVFEKGGMLVIAAWTERDALEKPLHLGDQVRVQPPLGARRASAAGERVTFGPLPIFLTGVDPSLIRIQQGLRFHDTATAPLAPDTLPLRSDPSIRALRFRNLFPAGPMDDVRVRILQPLPAGWTVRPLEASAPSLAPGEEFSQEVTLVLRADQEEGDFEVKLEVSFLREGRRVLLPVSRTVRLVPQIRLAGEAAELSSVPNARKVSVRIANAAGRPVNLSLRVRLPGQPEETQALGLVPAGPSGERRLEYVVRDVHLLDPARAAVEILCSERGGERLHARLRIPLR